MQENLLRPTIENNQHSRTLQQGPGVLYFCSLQIQLQDDRLSEKA